MVGQNLCFGVVAESNGLHVVPVHWMCAKSCFMCAAAASMLQSWHVHFCCAVHVDRDSGPTLVFGIRVYGYNCSMCLGH